MIKTLFFLQAGATDLVNKPINGDSTSWILSIVTAGFVAALGVLHKNYQNQLKDKDRQISKLESRVEAYERSVEDLRDNTMTRVNGILEQAVRIIQDNSIAINENSSAISEAKGVMMTVSETIIDGLRPIIENLNKHHK